MNNTKFKTKLISKILLFAILLTSALTLAGCPGYGHRSLTITYSSYDEMYEYAVQHKQEYPNDCCTFLMFDVDIFEHISTESYVGTTMWYDGWGEFFNVSQNDKLSDDHWPFNISSNFKADALLDNGNIIKDAYDIKCRYMGLAGEDKSYENLSGIKSSIINSKNESSENGYFSTYSVFVEGNISIDIEIKHNHEATQEELDAIVRIFLDNAVIIN